MLFLYFQEREEATSFLFLIPFDYGDLAF